MARPRLFNNRLENKQMLAQNRSHALAVAFLASDVNRFSINALTGALEQGGIEEVILSFPHPNNAQGEIERLLGVADTVVVAFSFMSSALVSTAQRLADLQRYFAGVRDRILF